MATSFGVEVQLLVNGKPLAVYLDPDDHQTVELRTKNFYVEAVPDAKFTIKIIAREDFAFLSADCLTAHIEIDGGSIWSYCALLKKSWEEHNRLENEISKTAIYSYSLQEWKYTEFTFGGLTILEDHSNFDAKPEKMEDLGSVKFTFCRVNRKQLAIPMAQIPPYNVGTCSEVPEKVPKGPMGGPTIAAPVKMHTYAGIGGAVGAPFVIRLLYRSKETLQVLGCIPKEPTPEMVPEPPSPEGHEIREPSHEDREPTHEDETPHEKDARLQALQAETEYLRAQNKYLRFQAEQMQARIAQLEGSPNARPKPAGPAGGLKRERGDGDLSPRSSPGPSKRSRASGRAKVMDPTAD